MEKWNASFLRAGFLSLYLFFHTLVFGQVIDCHSPHIKDSLVTRYITHGAERARISYMDPRWQLYCDSILMVCAQVAEGYQLKAIPYLKYGDYLQAMPLLDKAVLYDTLQFLPYRAFIKCIFAKDYSGAIEDFKESKRRAGNAGVMDHTFAFYMGLCFLESGKPSDARQYLAEDIRTQQARNGNTDAHFNSWLYYGIAQMDLQDTDSAIASLSKCLAIHTQHPEAHYYKAILLHSKGRREEARQHIQAALAAIKTGYSMNEDNLYYVYYPRQITLNEAEALLASIRLD